MDKKIIFQSLINELQGRFNVLKQSALDAKEAATNEESKAENKYDTRGLEASYLAGAQAKRATELMENIERLKSLKIIDFNQDTPVTSTALVHIEVDGEERKWFLITPCEGGIKINVDGLTIFSLTLESPLGKLLKKKKHGDYFDFTIKGEIKEYEILEVL